MMINKDLIKKILVGKKTWTCGDKPISKVGRKENLMANKDYSKISGKYLSMKRIFPKTLGSFTDKEAQKEGFQDLADFRNYWNKHEKKLGQWENERKVWVHEFEVV